jgi:putative thioredoxin
LPSLRVIKDGQLVDQHEGPQTETALTAIVDQLTLSSADVLKAQLDALLTAGELTTALDLLQQAVSEEPNNLSFKVELADVLIRQQMLDDAVPVLAGIPEEAEERERPAMRLELTLEARELADCDALTRASEQAPDDLELIHQLALRHAADGNFEQALEAAMSILQRDREFRDDIGRLTMLRMFTVLGKGSELTSGYRRRMFNFMH